MPRVLVADVPWRALASCRSSAWCITARFGAWAKIASGSRTSPVRLPAPSKIPASTPVASFFRDEAARGFFWVGDFFSSAITSWASWS
jgi:hypothetical protein